MNDEEYDPSLVLRRIYSELKEEEWAARKQQVPKVLKRLVWSADHAYLLYQLRYYTRVEIYGAMFQSSGPGREEKHYEIFRTLLDYRRSHVDSHVVLRSYRAVLDLSMTGLRQPGGEDEVMTLLNDVRSHREEFPREDLVDLFSMIGNLCSRQINRGDKRYSWGGFVAHAYQLESKYGADWKARRDTPLPPTIYINFITLALHSEATGRWSGLALDLINTKVDDPDISAWLYAFIRAYRSRLPVAERGHYENFAKAIVAFHDQDYFRAAKFLERTERSRIDLLNLKLMRLELMNSYEAAQLSGKSKVHLGARKIFNQNTDSRIKRFYSQLAYLGSNGKYDQHTAHFGWFIRGYSKLFSLHRHYGMGTPASSVLIQENIAALKNEFPGEQPPTEAWLLRKFMEKLE